MTRFTIISFLVFICCIAFASGQTCLPTNATAYWGLPFSTNSAPAQVGSNACNYTQSCCNQTALASLAEYWEQWRASLETSLEEAQEHYSTYDVRANFFKQINVGRSNDPQNFTDIGEAYREQVTNYLELLQDFYDAAGDNLEKCHKGSLDYYAGVLCSFCSVNISDRLIFEQPANNVTTAIWKFNNETCEHIYGQCQGLTDGVWGLLRAYNAIFRFEDDACSLGYIDIDRIAGPDTVCFRSCSPIVGWNFDLDIWFQNFTTTQPWQITRESDDATIRALQSWAQQELKQAMTLARSVSPTDNKLIQTRDRVAAGVGYVGRYNGTSLYGFENYSPTSFEFIQLRQLGTYSPAGFDVVPYGSRTSLPRDSTTPSTTSTTRSSTSSTTSTTTSPSTTSTTRSSTTTSTSAAMSIMPYFALVAFLISLMLL